MRYLDSHQFAEWIAYDGLEPFGEERADLRNGIVASVVANANRGKGQAAKRPTDFMPFYKKPRQTSDQLLAAMRNIPGVEMHV